MYVLEEQSDVFVDAAAADHRNQLLFVSAFGRDTSIQQFMARLHEARREGGIEQMSLRRPAGAEAWLLGESAGSPGNNTGAALQLFVGDPRRLEKHTGRLPRGLLGNLVHAWIFDPALLEADHATRSGWVFERVPSNLAPGALTGFGPQSAGNDAAAARRQIADRCWLLVKQLSPVPLLDAWREGLIGPNASAANGLALTTSPCIGPVHALRVEISEAFARYVSEAVRCGALRETPPFTH
ncbi:MAG: hypothetical protein JNN03_08130 [Rubrivivax sp.]|nr:hypothetical protein [Rubrivivax sp.]